MLEKIGLPAKPSMRGSNWVVDASHCQGCSSQFSFINRKHHCRRCGGLFCGACSAQRAVLRGQGDSPVRICEPCKKAEEAERFELRHGHRNRNAAKGSSKASSSKQEDELLAQLLGGTHKSPPKLLSNESSHLSNIPSNEPSSSSKSTATNEENEIIRSLSIGPTQNIDSNITPDELRQKAVEEKKLHRILKSQGKSSDALQAFKRGRELERQADALETALRKNRRLASKSSNQNVERVNKKESSGKKDDLASELRDLGWADTDLHETGANPNPVSLEGELSQLIGEITKKPLGEEGEKKKKGIDNSQVIAMKKRALVYKREGRLSEAKEELKKAKILEKQLEEKLILGDSDESDDELGALMRELDKGGKNNNNDFNADLDLNSAQLGLPIGGFDLEKLLSGDVDHFGDFDVTNADLNDPSLNSDLKSFGWSDNEQEEEEIQNSSLVDQVHALKKEAVVQKRAGNISEAMSLLKKAKLLEKNLQEVSSSKENSPDIKNKSSQTDPDLNPLRNPKPVTKNRLAIQRELLAVKKRALVLRREGKVEESERELERGKVLERELEGFDNGPKLALNQDPIDQNPLELNDEIGETEVTESDMRDPNLISVLRNLGWDENEEEKDDADVALKKSQIGNLAKKPTKRNKLAIQRELLTVKKHALALRREGKIEESERELERGRVLEREMQEFDAPIQTENQNFSDENHEITNTEVTETDMQDPDLNSVLKNLGWEENEDADVAPPLKEQKVNFAKKPAKKSKFTIQRELLAIKKNALALRREGKIEESERELERGKLLEEQLQELETEQKSPPVADVAPLIAVETPHIADVAPLVADVAPPTADVAPKRVRKKSKGEIQRELLVLKRKALQLRREGKEEEAESELEKAKILENELAELESNLPIGKTLNTTQVGNDVMMDPEILAVLNNLGHGKNEGADVAPSHLPPEKKVKTEPAEPFFEEKTEPVVLLSDENNLKNEILMHKRRAVALKREGKLSEAKEELKQAKLLEKNLEEETIQKNTSLNTDINTNKQVYVEPVREVIKPVPTRKPVSGRERFKIQQESLSHKRNALKLRREGKIAESEAEFELAKSLEAQFDEINGDNVGSTSNDDVMIDDFLDPALMSALRSIGWEAEGSGRAAEVEERESGVRVGEERERMEEEIRREKIRAVGLKRAGKTKEAMEILRNAKLMEKKLGLIN